MLARLRAAEAAAGRPPGSVRLVAVTKGHSADDIRRHVLAHGAFPLAESRGQELRDKARELQVEAPEWPEPEWHFIGPIQSNKVKYLQPVTLIHTIETEGQAAALARQAEGWGRAPGLLLQLHNGEAQKHGVAPEALDTLYHRVSEMGLTVRGLMVMAPYGDSTAAARVFAGTRARAEALNLGELSMGMSDDFELAVQHGATLVRVGRLLFEP